MSESKQVHVVMLPWLAFGHMIPFLELSIALAKHGIHVSFLSTPRNIQRLPKIPPNLSQIIHFVSFPLPNPASDPLPENSESTNDVLADKMDALRIACDLLHHPIKNYIADKLPSSIIVDFFPHWAADIAQEFNIPLIKYSLTSAATTSFFWLSEFLAGANHTTLPRDFTTPPDWVDFPSKVAYRNHETAAVKNVLFRANSSGISDGGRLMKLNQASAAIAIRTSSDFEADYLRVISNLTGKPVFPVGFLPRKTAQVEEPLKQSSIFRWLDEQNPRSVVFVVFGSESNISREQIHEIAYGLELSKLPFLWAVRKPKDGDGGHDLPPGFCTRTAAQGVVEMGWVPQFEILGHASIGGVVGHAGWSSIIEAMQLGKVLVLLPLAVDQPLNARLMAEEKGLAVEVERAEDGSFSRYGIAAAVREGMLSDQLRAGAEQAAAQIFGNDDLNCRHVKEFAQFLKFAKI